MLLTMTRLSQKHLLEAVVDEIPGRINESQSDDRNRAALMAASGGVAVLYAACWPSHPLDDPGRLSAVAGKRIFQNPDDTAV